MRTDDLISMLAAGASPVEPHATRRRYAAALGWGAFGSTLLMAIMLGVRPDIRAAAQLPMFWFKLVFPLCIAFGALHAAVRLSRPGYRLGRVPGALAATLAVAWLVAASALLSAAPPSRPELIFGQSWYACPAYIALLSAPSFVAAHWAMKGLAPTRLALAGAAAGLLAGGIGAAAYALHCTEIGAPFLAIWYVAGMLIPAFVGALVGPFMLRW